MSWLQYWRITMGIWMFKEFQVHLGSDALELSQDTNFGFPSPASSAGRIAQLGVMLGSWPDPSYLGAVFVNPWMDHSVIKTPGYLPYPLPRSQCFQCIQMNFLLCSKGQSFSTGRQNHPVAHCENRETGQLVRPRTSITWFAQKVADSVRMAVKAMGSTIHNRTNFMGAIKHYKTIKYHQFI